MYFPPKDKTFLSMDMAMWYKIEVEDLSYIIIIITAVIILTFLTILDVYLVSCPDSIQGVDQP